MPEMPKFGVQILYHEVPKQISVIKIQKMIRVGHGLLEICKRGTSIQKEHIRLPVHPVV
jgi:hypothetical protein